MKKRLKLKDKYKLGLIYLGAILFGQALSILS